MTTGYRITVGWLLVGAASGRIPKPATTSEAEVAVDTIRLSLQEQGGPLPGRVCIPARGDVAVSLASGQSIGITRDMAAIRLEPVHGIVANTYPIQFGHPFFGNRLTAVRPVAFRVIAPAHSPALVCGNADVMERSRVIRAGR